jgi:hypothetical protein
LALDVIAEMLKWKDYKIGDVLLKKNKERR